MTDKESFAARVYQTMRAQNVDKHVRKKGKLSYLPWAPAWNILMQHFPESDFKFDEPKMFSGSGGEQWVTVNVREGDNILTRQWWLPYLDYSNKPVANPSSMQINTTRMRVLVKCLAMCGLGTELYTGEDVPDASQDVEVSGASEAASYPADVEKIEACTTLEELQEVWLGLPPAARKALTAVKDRMKTDLS